MNITFLVGNGFDIGLGLKSRFSDYYPIYIEQAKSKPNFLKGLADNISSDLQNWSDFEIEMGRYTDKFTPSTKRQYIFQINDFENGLANYLQNEEAKINPLDANKVCDKIISTLKTFYIHPNLPNGSSDAINRIFNEHKLDDFIYNFIDFNYTTVLDKCLNSIPDKLISSRTVGIKTLKRSIGDIVHVHGSIGDSPIIGLNDISQISNSELRYDKNFSDLIVKPKINSLICSGNDTKTDRIIQNSNIICVYGMSLGYTDKIWWETIIKWLEKDSSRELIIYNCDKQFTASTHVNTILKRKDILNTLFLLAKDAKIIFEKIRPHIHISLNRNIFEMDLIKKDTEEEQVEVEAAATQVTKEED